jgi:RNA polymerase sigma-70 factor, ECF subfamily
LIAAEHATMHSTMDIGDLTEALDAAHRGDERGIAELYRAFNPQLLRYFRHHLSDGAEDLASETWLAAARGLGTFVGDIGAFRAWLFTIARRRVVDQHRSRARQPTTVASDTGNDHSDSVDVSQVAVEKLSVQQAIEQVVANLPADQAEVVLLRIVADLGVEDVATIMGRSTGSVRVLQHRALRHLAKTWNQQSVTD